MKSAENSLPAAPPPSTQSWNLVVVDGDPKTVEWIRKAAVTVTRETYANGTPHLPIVRVATSIDAAEAEMLRKPADLLVINLQIGDQAGVDLIRNFKRRYHKTDIVALSRNRKPESCLDAWRAGAGDMLLSPYTAADVERALLGSYGRHRHGEKIHQRNVRLRMTCRRLNKARHEISQQVDLLCNDLVRAYQDIAHQLNLAQTAAEFGQTLSGELDVEGVLRKTMEWVLHKLGPVNAAIYLPSGDEFFALGAYLNLDTQADASLIETLARTIIQQSRGASSALAIDDDAILRDLFGEEAEPLIGRQWVAVACHTPRECLGILTVFRTRQPSDAPSSGLPPTTRALIEAVAPILGERIEQALSLYQRLHPDEDEPLADEPD